MLKGGCFVGGSPFVAWFSVPRSRFRWACGAPARFRSTAKGTRSFCPRRGTQLTFEHDELPNEIDVTTCSLEQPDRLPPKDHTHASSRLGWIRLADQLPEYPQSRS